MKKLLLPLFLLMLSPYCWAQNINYHFAKSFGGTSYEQTQVVVDSDNNMYLFGSFQSVQISFDNVVLTNSDNSESTTDLFLAKLKSNGAVIWAKKFGGINSERASNITLSKDGQIIICGSYINQVQFDNIVLTQNTLSSIFICTIDTTGSVIWAKSSSGSSNNNSVASGLTSCNNGDILLFGDYVGNSFSLSSLNINNNNSNGSNIYYTRLDANGNCIWLNTITSSSGTGHISAGSVKEDNFGDIILTGSFWCNTINFGNNTLTNNGTGWFNCDYYVAKLNNSGNILWALSDGGPDDDYIGLAAINHSNDYFFVTSFASLAISVNNNTYNNKGATGTYDYIISKYNANGTEIWSKQIGGNDDDEINLTIDSMSNLFVTGWFGSDSLLLDGIKLQNNGFGESYIGCLDTSGTFLWAKTEGGAGYEHLANTFDTYGHVILYGDFGGSSPLILGSFNLLPVGGSDIFISRLQNYPLSLEQNYKFPINFCPNPTSGLIHFSNPTKYLDKIRICDLAGRDIENFHVHDNSVDFSHLANGVYILNISIEGKFYVTEFVKE